MGGGQAGGDCGDGRVGWEVAAVEACAEDVSVNVCVFEEAVQGGRFGGETGERGGDGVELDLFYDWGGGVTVAGIGGVGGVAHVVGAEDAEGDGLSCNEYMGV